MSQNQNDLSWAQIVGAVLILLAPYAMVLLGLHWICGDDLFTIFMGLAFLIMGVTGIGAEWGYIEL